MKLSNAEALIGLPESKRLTEYWLRRASTDPISVFREAVEKETEGKRLAGDSKEKVVSISIKASSSQRKVIEAGLQEYSVRIGEPGHIAKAAEVLVAESQQGVTLIEAITKAISKLHAIKGLSNSGKSADEVLAETHQGIDEVVESFRHALEITQEEGE